MGLNTLVACEAQPQAFLRSTHVWVPIGQRLSQGSRGGTAVDSVSAMDGPSNGSLVESAERTPRSRPLCMVSGRATDRSPPRCPRRSVVVSPQIQIKIKIAVSSVEGWSVGGTKLSAPQEVLPASVCEVDNRADINNNDVAIEYLVRQRLCRPVHAI